MTAQRQPAAGDPEDRYLDAAREVVLAVGVRHTTLTSIAKRAGVSRMTLYRQWPDVTSLLADLMTREWLRAIAAATSTDAHATPRQIAQLVGHAVAAVRENELVGKIVAVDPELLLPYLLQRRGRTQTAILELLRGVLRPRRNADAIATAILLTAQSFALSGAAFDDLVPPAERDRQLRRLIEAYLS